MDFEKYTIQNVFCISWPVSIETLLLEVLRTECKWFVLQEKEKTIGCINRNTLYEKVKEQGLNKAIKSLPLEDLIINPIFINNTKDIDHFQKDNKVLILKSDSGQIEGIVEWKIDAQSNDLIDSDNWLLSELGKIFYDLCQNILISDGDGNIIRATSEDDKQYLGKNVFDLERQREFYPSVTARVLNTGNREKGLQYTKTGEVFTIESFPIKDHEGKIIRVVSITKESQEINNLIVKLNEVKNLLNSYQQEVIKKQNDHFEQKSFIYISKEMDDLNNLIKTVAPVDTTVLILGETGVGKGVVANQIHNLSNRYDKPFITVDCGAIPENLIESELFGYEEGAFSGAKRGGNLGVFELANTGTVFLDEIGEMPLHLQVKLLRVIQEKRVKRIGGAKENYVDVRIIAATNQNLEKQVKEKTFRKDLYYRLNVIPIQIPPLRERKEDINALAFYYLIKFNNKYNKNREIYELMLERLRKYSWPGNVRELENIIERFVVTGHDYLSEINQTSLSPCKELSLGTDGKFPYLFDFLEEIEQQILMEAKLKSKTTRDMAHLLGVNQSTISRKLKKYNL